MVTIESERVVVLVLVVENVTDRKAAWILGQRGRAAQRQHAGGVAAADAVLSW